MNNITIIAIIVIAVIVIGLLLRRRGKAIEPWQGEVKAKKKAEEEIKSLSKFPEENPNLIGRVDHDGKLLYCNPAYKKIFKDNYDNYYTRSLGHDSVIR